MDYKKIIEARDSDEQEILDNTKFSGMVKQVHSIYINAYHPMNVDSMVYRTTSLIENYRKPHIRNNMNLEKIFRSGALHTVTTDYNNMMSRG